MQMSLKQMTTRNNIIIYTRINQIEIMQDMVILFHKVHGISKTKTKQKEKEEKEDKPFFKPIKQNHLVSIAPEDRVVCLDIQWS